LVKTVSDSCIQSSASIFSDMAVVKALKRFLIEDGVGKDQRFCGTGSGFFLRYIQIKVMKKRWVDGVLARKKGAWGILMINCERSI